MARIRTIKPQHWSDKQLSKLPLGAHLLWIGTWNFSDDEGIFENDPLLIRSNIFPRRTDVRVEQVSQWLDQLVKARFLIPFTYNGESYYIHRTFKTHQKIDKPQPSKIPEEAIRRLFDERSSNVLPCIVEESIVEESRVAPDKPASRADNPLKKSGKKKKDEPPEPFWHPLVDTWFSFVKEKFGEEPSFSGADPRILKEIISLLKKRAESKQVEWTESNAIERFKKFLDMAYREKWLSQNFLLSNLKKQFDSIILNNLNNGSHKQAVGANNGQPASRKSAGAQQLLTRLKNELGADI